MKRFFLLLLLIQLMVIVYFAISKQNLFLDEIYTFGFANSFYMTVRGFCDFYNVILDKNFFHDILTVQANEAFEYNSVLFNLKYDVHPPLHYILIYTISSMFENQFSKWFGIFPNMLFFVLNQIIILFISRNLLKQYINNKYIMFLPCIFYGFSMGTINSILYIRMYMMLSFFSIIFFYLNILLFKTTNNNMKKQIKIFIMLFFVTILGSLTHYIFIVYVFIIYIVYFIFFKKNKSYLFFFLYGCINLLALSTVYYIYPIMYDQVLGYKANPPEVNNILITFKNYISLFCNDIFGGKILAIIIIILLVYMYIYVHLRKKNKNKELRYNKHSMLGIIIILAYFICISKVAPLAASRYLYIIYPLFSVVFISNIIYLIKINNITEKTLTIFFVIFCFIINMVSYKVDNIAFRNESYVKVEEKISRNDNLIMVNSENIWAPSQDIFLLGEKANYSYFINENYMDNFFDNRIYTDKLWVYISKTCKKSDLDILKLINKNNFYDKIDKVCKTWHGNIYLLEKVDR